MLLKLLFYYVRVCVFNKSNRVYLVFIRCNFKGEREREREREREESEREREISQASQVVRVSKKKNLKKREILLLF